MLGAGAAHSVRRAPHDRCHRGGTSHALRPSRKARASTTRRPAEARRSCSSTSSAATSAAGTTRCATSGAAGAASPGPRAAIRCRTRPTDEKLYGQDFFNRDAIAVLDAAGIDKAHVVGLSMGGYTALMLAAKFPERVISCVAAGAGSGALKATRTQFIEDSLASAPPNSSAPAASTPRPMALGSDARAAAEQGPDRLAHLRRAPGRASGARRRQDAAHGAGRPRLALRPGGRAEGHQGAGAAAGRRRGRALPRRQPMDEAADADRAARRCCRAPATPSTWRSRRCSTGWSSSSSPTSSAAAGARAIRARRRCGCRGARPSYSTRNERISLPLVGGGARGGGTIPMSGIPPTLCLLARGRGRCGEIRLVIEVGGAGDRLTRN